MAGESLNDKQNAAYTTDAVNDIPAGAVRVCGTIATMGGSSGGGGAVTIADGADTTEGSVADAAVTSDAAGTVSGKLRGFIKILADVWDPINHWIKVSVSSSAIIQPVSITTGFPAIQPVSITTGFPAVQPVSISSGVPLIVNPGNLLTANIIQFATGTVLTGPGLSGVGVPRVTLSSDSMIRITDGTTTGLIIAGTNALKTDLSSVAGTVTETARAGVQRVGLLGATGVSLDAATGAVLPLNSLVTGYAVSTSNPKASTNALMVQGMADKLGRQVVVAGHIRELTAASFIRIDRSSAEQTILSSSGLGVFNDICSLTITTTFASIGTLTIKDATAGTTRMFLNYPNANVAPSSPMVLFFQPPLPQNAANSNWTVTQSSSTAMYTYNITYIKNL